MLNIRFEDLISGEKKICVVGLGYVGLPLAILLSKKFKIVGFDINKKRVEDLKRGVDRSREVDREELLRANIEFSCEEKVLQECDIIIIAVPTPIDKLKDPDLKFIEHASKIVGRNLKPGSVVVYESTVWPGLTEEVCVPILERESGLRWKEDFFIAYSPERVNPGDKEHTIDKIVKVVAGDTAATAELVAKIYDSVIDAGIYIAPDIRTAEAAKVIENIQRDINIALMNELSIIFHKLNIETKEVLKAAYTKWNFLKFEPGLVGGHCIGVDPYYLAKKAKEVGYIPQLILAGRHINEYIPEFIAHEMIKLLIKNNKNIKGSKVLVLGFSFKENVPDVRNTKVYDLLEVLREYEISFTVVDPIADKEDAKREYGITVQDIEDALSVQEFYDAIVVAVKHNEFKSINIHSLLKISTTPCILLDVKGVFERAEAEASGIVYWSL